MRIISTGVTDCSRFALANIKSVHVNLGGPVNLYLGTNGSGKSTFMEYTLGLPVAAGAFGSEGILQTEIEHNGEHYYLVSDFTGKKPKYEFFKNGDNLNESFQVSTQRELYMKEFGLDDDAIHLLRGTRKSNFTDMTKSRRKDIFTKMSINDLTYVTRLYNKAATATRDLKGAIKHTKKRITELTDKARQVEDLKESELAIENAKTVLEELRAIKWPKKGPSDFLHNAQAELHDIIVGRSEALMNLAIINPTNVDFDSVQDIRLYGERLKAEIIHNSDIYNRVLKDHESILKVAESLESGGAADVSELEARVVLLEGLRKEKAAALADCDIDIAFEGDQRGLLRDSIQLVGSVVDILTNTPDKIDNHLSKEDIVKFRDEKDRLAGNLSVLTHNIHRVKHRISDIEAAKETKCPDCGYTWKEGVSEKDLAEATLKLKELENALAKEQEKKVALDDREQVVARYLNSLKAWQKLRADYPEAHQFFDWFISNNYHAVNPSSNTRKVKVWAEALAYHQSIVEISSEIEDVSKVLQHAKLVSGTGVKEDIEKAKARLAEHQDIDRRLKAELKELTKYESSISRAFELLEGVESTYANWLEKVIDYITALDMEGVDYVIDKQLEVLAKHTSKLDEYKLNQGVIRDLEADLVKLESDLHRYQIVTKALGPQEGLIAEELMTFITGFVDKVNDILEQVFSYPIEVLPCDIEKTELSYKFPVRTGDDGYSEDISECSDGQMEMINLAFRLTAIYYLGLCDYPLYMDEVGRTLDEHHLPNLMEMAKSLPDAKRCGQLHMVSHFAAGHGSYTNANVVVFDGTNITVPSNANQNATFT